MPSCIRNNCINLELNDANFKKNEIAKTYYIVKKNNSFLNFIGFYLGKVTFSTAQINNSFNVMLL